MISHDANNFFVNCGLKGDETTGFPPFPPNNSQKRLYRRGGETPNTWDFSCLSNEYERLYQ